MMADGELVIRAPGRESPGYLRRLRKALALSERAQAGLSLALLDEMVAFVLAEATVTAPAGVAVAEALLDLSKAEWDGVLRAVSGSLEAVDAVDPPSGG